MKSFRKSSFVAACIAALLFAVPARSASITVFAAASLTDALQDIGQAWEAKKGTPVTFSFASSSTLAKQIEAGAPAQIFASADKQWMDDVESHGLVEAGTRTNAVGNELVLIAPADTTTPRQTIDRSLDWARLLGKNGRLSVGDPDHVPAGIYAKEALINLGAWGVLEPFLARGEDVRAALTLVEQDQAPLGIVYATDAKISQKVKIVGEFPADSHSPIVYPFAILKGQASPEVRALFAYMTGPDGMAIFRKYGFKTH